MDAEDVVKENVEDANDNDYAPVEVIVRGKGEEGKKEAKILLETLSRLRRCDGIKKNGDNGELVITGNVTREKRFKGEPGEKTMIFETPDYSVLTVTPNSNGGYDIKLEEELGKEETVKGLEILVKSLEIMGEVGDLDIEYTRGQNGQGEEKLIATFPLRNIRQLTASEQEALRQIQIYRELQKEVRKRLEKLKENPKERDRFPLRGTLDYIQYWTHLTPQSPTNRLTVAKELKARIQLLEVADFLRELYTIIQIKTRVTREEIESGEKKRHIAKQRHIAMYMTRKKFGFLSSNEVGVVFGPIGNQKNHATILLNEKNEFDESAGIRPENYPKIDDVITLYNDSKEKYEKAHEKD